MFSKVSNIVNSGKDIVKGIGALLVMPIILSIPSVRDDIMNRAQNAIENGEFYKES